MSSEFASYATAIGRLEGSTAAIALALRDRVKQDDERERRVHEAAIARTKEDQILAQKMDAILAELSDIRTRLQALEENARDVTSPMHIVDEAKARTGLWAALAGAIAALSAGAAAFFARSS